MKKFHYLYLILALFTIFFISACNEKIKTGQGVGYYISSKSTSSPIQNIKYTCGEHEGNTTFNGKFIYSVNRDCSFFLNDKKVGSISKDKLSTILTDINNKVVEDGILSNRILRVVDNDGYVGNGIKITKEILDILKNKNLPTSTNELKILSQQIRTQKIFSLSEEYIPTEIQIQNELFQIKKDIKLELAAKNIKIDEPSTYYGDFTKNSDNNYSLLTLNFKKDILEFEKEKILTNSTQNIENNLTYVLVGLTWKEHNKSSSIITYNFNDNSGLYSHGFKKISIHKLEIIKAYETIKIKNSNRDIKNLKITDADVSEYTFKITAHKDFYEIYEHKTGIANLGSTRQDKKIIIAQTKNGKDITFAENEGLETTSGKIIANNEDVGTWDIKKIGGIDNMSAIFINIDSKYNKDPNIQYFFVNRNNRTNDIWQGRKYKKDIEIESLVLYKTKKAKDEFIKIIQE